jgi:hypothetical protein
MNGNGLDLPCGPFSLSVACEVMRIKRFPTAFIIPAQPVLALKPPSGPKWVHEIKHDGYRMIARREGATARLYSRNANDWTLRLAGIAAVAERIKSTSFTIDGEAVLGPAGLSRFEELSRREAADTAILYAFDLIEHHGEDMRNLLVPRPQSRDGTAVPGLASCSMNTSRGLCRLRARLPAWRRRHRFHTSRRRVSIRPVPRLDQGP